MNGLLLQIARFFRINNLRSDPCSGDHKRVARSRSFLRFFAIIPQVALFLPSFLLFFLCAWSLVFNLLSFVALRFSLLSFSRRCLNIFLYFMLELMEPVFSNIITPFSETLLKKIKVLNQPQFCIILVLLFRLMILSLLLPVNTTLSLVFLRIGLS